MANASFPFELISPEKLIFSGEILKVILPATNGQMTVMKHHASTIASLRPGLIEITKEDNSQSIIFVNGGFVDIGNDSLRLLAEQAIPEQAINSQIISNLLKDEEKRIAQSKGDEKDNAETCLAYLKVVKQSLAL